MFHVIFLSIELLNNVLFVDVLVMGSILSLGVVEDFFGRNMVGECTNRLTRSWDNIFLEKGVTRHQDKKQDLDQRHTHL